MQSINYFNIIYNGIVRFSTFELKFRDLGYAESAIKYLCTREHVRSRLTSNHLKIGRNKGDLYLPSNYRRAANVPIGQIYIGHFACSTTSRAVLGYRARANTDTRSITYNATRQTRIHTHTRLAVTRHVYVHICSRVIHDGRCG